MAVPSFVAKAEDGMEERWCWGRKAKGCLWKWQRCSAEKLKRHSQRSENSELQVHKPLVDLSGTYQKTYSFGMTRRADSADSRRGSRLSGGQDAEEPARLREAGEAQRPAHRCAPWPGTVPQGHDSHPGRQMSHSSTRSCQSVLLGKPILRTRCRGERPARWLCVLS